MWETRFKIYTSKIIILYILICVFRNMGRQKTLNWVAVSVPHIQYDEQILTGGFRPKQLWLLDWMTILKVWRLNNHTDICLHQLAYDSAASSVAAVTVLVPRWFVCQACGEKSAQIFQQGRLMNKHWRKKISWLVMRLWSYSMTQKQNAKVWNKTMLNYYFDFKEKL